MSLWADVEMVKLPTKAKQNRYKLKSKHVWAERATFSEAGVKVTVCELCVQSISHSD